MVFLPDDIMPLSEWDFIFMVIKQNLIYKPRKCLLHGHILAPPEELRAPELPGVNPGCQPQESGGDSKAI